MIFGDPASFAVLIDYVPAWGSGNSYKNGIFHFIINNEFFPKSASVATLDGDVYCLSKDNALINPRKDAILFKMEKFKSFSFMLGKMLPNLLNPEADVAEDFEADYGYQASTYNLEDNGSYVFAVNFQEEIRILGAATSYLSGNDIDGYKWKKNEHIDVHEIILPKSEVVNIIKEVKLYYDFIKK